MSNPPTSSTGTFTPSARVRFNYPYSDPRSGEIGILVVSYRGRDGVILTPQLTLPGSAELTQPILENVLCGANECQDTAVWTWDTTSVVNGTHTLVARITDERGYRYEDRVRILVLNASSPVVVTSTGGVAGSTATIGASVNITSGAVAGPQTVLIQPTLPTQPQLEAASAQNLLPAGSAAEFTVEGREEGMTFDEPVVISLTYDPSVSDPRQLRLCWWNESAARWEPLPGAVTNFNDNVISAEADHFTFFAVMRLAPAAASEPFGEVFSFPNPAPAGSPITWRVHIDSAQEFRIHLLTLDGRLAASVAVPASLSTGPDGRFLQDIPVETEGLAPGTYVAVIEAASGEGIAKTLRKFSVRP